MRGFTAVTGAAAGLFVAGVAAGIAIVRLLPRSGIGGLELFPRLFWVTEYVAPLVALALVGATTGAVAQRSSGYDPPDFARAPEQSPQWGSGPGSTPAG